MRHYSLSVCASLACLLMAGPAFAYDTGYSVGLNFVSAMAPGSLQPADVAGVPAVKQANWNNALPDAGDTTGSLLEVTGDDRGAPVISGMTISWSCANTWTSTGGGEENNYFTDGPDRTLMTGYLDTGGATTTTITLSTLPPELLAGYDVYIYMLGGVGNKGGGYRVLDASGTPLTDYLLGDGPVTPSEYIRDLGWNHQDQGDYLVFRGLTASDILIEATTANGLGYDPNGGPRAPVNAVQLVAATLDTTAPTVPANFQAAQVGETAVELTWGASIEAGGTVWYELERDGVLLSTLLGTNFHDVNVLPKKTYVYQVRALDDSRNASDYAPERSVTLAGAATKPFSIAVNFTSERQGPSTLAASDVAGVLKQANWNNSAPPGAAGTITDLVADDGGEALPTTATVTWSCPNTWTSTGGGEENNAFPAGPDRILMTGYVDTGDATTTTIQVSGLPPELTSGYDLYVYLLGGIGNKGGGYRILDDTGAVLRDNLLGDGAVNPTNFVRDLGLTHQDLGNYLVFRSLTAPSFTLEASTANDLGYPVGGGPRAPVNALQLVAAPLDATPPSVPAKFEAALVGESFVDLRWDPATDESSTLWYEIYRDGTLLTKQVGNTFRDTSVQGLTDYAYQVGAVDDAANSSALSTPLAVQTPGPVEARAAVRDELYTGMDTTTTAVAELLANPNFPDSPNAVLYSTWPEGPTSYGDGYGSRLSGWFTPAIDGDYIFFVSADDNAELYLSPDDSAANKVRIAAESSWSNAREWIASSGGSDNTAKRSDQYTGTQWPSGNTITLSAGVKHYFEVLQKEGGGGDNVGFTWCRAGEPLPQNGDAPIIGPELSAMIDPTGASVAITTQPINVTATAGSSATISLAATGASPYGATPSYQWYRNGEPVRNANSAAYATPELTVADDNGARFKCFVAVPGAFVFSDEMTLKVIPDTAPPRIMQVTVNGLQALTVVFDEPVEQATAETAANYKIAPGVTVQSALLLAGNTMVRLTTTAVTPNKLYTLTAGGIQDRFGNILPAGSTFAFLSKVVGYADIILADKPVAFYRFEETGGTTATNSGSKGGNGAYMLYNGSANIPQSAKTGAGPQPPDFLGFGSGNQAALFDAFSISSGGDWVDCRNQFLSHLAAFSLEYWVYPVRTNSDGLVLPTRAGIVGQNDAVEYGFIDPGTIQIWTPSGGSLNTTYTFPDGQWHHVATIADGKSIKNYFDGKFINSTTASTTDYGSASYNVHIGGGGVFDTTGNFFNGLIDEVAIFDKAIPAERIAAHFQAGKVGGTAPSEQARFTSITCAAGQVTIQWDILAILEEASTLQGPWTPSANQANPQTIPASGTKFFRLRN
jgi:hypothetical protein